MAGTLGPDGTRGAERIGAAPRPGFVARHRWPLVTALVIVVVAAAAITVLLTVQPFRSSGPAVDNVIPSIAVSPTVVVPARSAELVVPGATQTTPFTSPAVGTFVAPPVAVTASAAPVVGTPSNASVSAETPGETTIVLRAAPGAVASAPAALANALNPQALAVAAAPMSVVVRAGGRSGTAVAVRSAGSSTILAVSERLTTGGTISVTRDGSTATGEVTDVHGGVALVTVPLRMPVLVSAWAGDGTAPRIGDQILELTPSAGSSRLGLLASTDGTVLRASLPVTAADTGAAVLDRSGRLIGVISGSADGNATLQSARSLE